MMLGRRIGSYEVISKLGEGGMGVVYLARHTMLGRLAAVKVLRSEYSHQREIVSRFFNEARAATSIRHAGIIEVYDFGFVEDQHAYIVMEYLEGESLGVRLRRGALAFPSLLAISRSIARALHAAHEKGIVHRDLKPDNVFLVPDEDLPGGERVKLLDFGIAKLTANSNETGQTRTGMVIGTPTYMSPEQCRATGAIDFRADLYALGCVMYQMAAGRPPFVSDAPADLLAHHLYFEPQRVSTLRADVPPALEQLVMALLAKVPVHRPASASAVVKAIDAMSDLSLGAEQAGSGAVVSIPATGPSPHASESARTTLSGAAGAVDASRRRFRRPLMIALSAVGAALIVVGIVAVSSPSESGAGSAASSAASRVVQAPEVSPTVPASIATPTPTPAPAPEPAPPAASTLAPAAVSEPAPPAAAPESEPPAAAPEPPRASPSASPRRAKDRSEKPSSSMRSSISTKPTAPVEDEKKPPAKCARALFQAVIDEAAPSEAAIQAALAKLRECKASLGDAAFSELQKRLVGRL